MAPQIVGPSLASGVHSYIIAFSYSTSQLPSIIDYIKRQEEHHAKRSFRDEYRLLLEKFEVLYEDKYLFKELEGY